MNFEALIPVPLAAAVKMLASAEKDASADRLAEAMARTYLACGAVFGMTERGFRTWWLFRGWTTRN